jgi:hypothetical protein
VPATIAKSSERSEAWANEFSGGWVLFAVLISALAVIALARVLVTTSTHRRRAD